MKLDGKKVTVTGGSRGPGLGLVESLVRECPLVTVVARGKEALSPVLRAKRARRDC